MRIGIFGGSFDPPHVGHLLVAQDAREALQLDTLLVVPASTQPLKPDGTTRAADRLAMVERCFGAIHGIEIETVEIDRGGLSFAVDTVEALRRRWPAAELFLLIGDDVAATLPRWREPERLLAMVQLVVLHRETADRRESQMAASDTGTGSGVVDAVRSARRLATRRVDVSSTEIRARVREGRSIRGFVPAAVEAYIASAGLYLRAMVVDDVSGRA